jgi:integrase
MTARCPAGHKLTSHGLQRPCAGCRRDALIQYVITAGGPLPASEAAAAVDAVATSPAVLRELAAALAADPDMLAHGAPPVAWRLAAELIARGSKTVTVPGCARCGRAGMPLYRTPGGGMCKPCTARQITAACAHCGQIKPAVSRDAAGQRICERCRRRDRGHRQCGACGQTASIAVRARGGAPDICVKCYRMPSAVCGVCGKYRECNFAGSGHPVCPSCSPRATARCARCGQDRPPQARWPEGPVCDPCYTAALRHRAPCASCGQLRRPVTPPGPAADTCASCAGQPVTCACTDCGVEDKLYERGRCERCSLRRRATALLTGPGGDIPAALIPVFEAICAARTPKSALNWLRRDGGAAILAQVASGTLPATHQALDAHPRRRAADHLRQALVAGGVLPPRNEELARTGQWLTGVLAAIEPASGRRLVQAYATWHVMRRLRASAGNSGRPRTYTARARNNIRAAADFTTWLARRGRSLRQCRQADVDNWLATGPGAGHVRDFLTWAAAREHSATLDVPGPARRSGTAASQDERWAQAARLLHDDTLDLTDRAAGCLLLLYGQQLSRIAALTTSQITSRDGTVLVRLGRHDAPVPEPLGVILTELIRTGRTHAGTGAPASTPWLFPGGLPGRPITASRLGQRLNRLGIYAMAGRRATLTDLAARMPAAVLADLLHLAPGTAVRWTREAGADWNRYAADLARTRNHQHGE